MADSSIGALPLAPNVADDSLLVMEQQGAAMKVTGLLLKEYAKQGVELEFKSDLEASQAAADRAESAASAVVDMTVDARTLDNGEPATVSKSMKNGKVNLSFGLPRGEQGVPGPAGSTGPRGPQGAPGNGLTILGSYDTEAALRAAVTAPSAGDAYGVGLTAPYDIYVFDSVSNDWKNYGPLSGGGGGGVLPEDVVTSEGGAVLEIPATLGDAPHTIEVTDEEEPPLTARDIEYDGAAAGMPAQTVQEAVDALFTAVGDGKSLIASAITDKGVPTQQDATFQEMADNIGQITTGGDTSDATATPGDILAPKTAYTASGRVEGIIPSLPARTITPGTAAQTIANGQYIAGTQVIQGDTNLVSSNIRKGVSIFGVPGAMESEFAATLTVTADIGAVVTATCGDTSVEALSTTGTVVLELPIEGTWKVTAVRGMAQYNTVTLEVSSSYSAALTAALHVQYFMRATPLDGTSAGVSASVGDYAIFYGSGAGDTYDSDLVHGSIEKSSTYGYGAAHTEKFAVFAGGSYGSDIFSSAVITFDAGLSKDTSTASLATARAYLAGASVGGYVIFGGGYTTSGTNTSSFGYTYYDDAEAFDDELVRRVITPLATTIKAPVAASNENYSIFINGEDSGSYVSAYSKSLTRSIASGLSERKKGFAAATAGSYILFAGGAIVNGAYQADSVDAYDLFLTRTTAEAFSVARNAPAATTLNGFAVFGGGTTGKYSTPANTVDVYDPYLVRTTPDPLPLARYGMSSAAVGPYALFAGGSDLSGSTSSRSRVEVYRYT